MCKMSCGKTTLRVDSLAWQTLQTVCSEMAALAAYSSVNLLSVAAQSCSRFHLNSGYGGLVFEGDNRHIEDFG